LPAAYETMTTMSSNTLTNSTVTPLASAVPPTGDVWGNLATTLSVVAVVERAQQLSRKGKLPGFAKVNDTFSFAGFGEPFDYTVVARAAEGGLSFHAKMQQKLPIIFAVVIAVSVWPGSWLTDSMLRSYFESYNFSTWFTYAWYIPLTVVPLLWMIPRMLRKSRQAAYAHTCEQIETLRAALNP